ncbi:MAG: oligosaccharide flippase family protein [Candidatus Marinimicrobia bacterium]|nr:oligosaccharide flippase family protein [Candidatus Neomarinimicrobiota bacterium]
MSLIQLGKQSVVYGFGHFITRFINFLLLPLYTHRLSPEEYGVVSLIYAFIAFANILFTHGMDVAYMRFQGLEKTEENKKTIFSTSFIWLLMSTLLLGSLMYFVSQNLATLTVGIKYTKLIQLAIGILAFDTLIALPKVLLRLENKPYHFVFLELSHVIIVLGLNIWWIGIQQLSINYIFISNLIASGITFLLIVPKIIKTIEFRFNPGWWKGLFIFALPYIPSGLASILNELIDRYMINWLVDENAVGLYSASYRLGIFMLIVVMAFKFAWQPYYLGQADKKDAPQLFAQTGTYFLLVTTFLFLFLSFFIEYLVQIPIGGSPVINPVYWDSLSIVPIVLLAYIFLGVFLVQLPGIYIKKKNGWIPILNGIAALINISANFILIPKYGYKSAAVATLLGYSVMVVLQYYVIKRFYPLTWEWKRVLIITIISGILFIVWKFSGEYWIVGLINIGLYPILLWIAPFFTTNEKQFIQSKFKFKK